MLKKKLFKYFIVFFLLLNASSIFANEILAIDKNEVETWRKNNLSLQQISWLTQHKTIHHGMVKGKIHQPFEYTDEQNIHKGLTSDYLKIISEKLGITFVSKTRTKHLGELSIKLNNKEIDLVSYLPKTKNNNLDIHYSNTIIKMPIILLGRNNDAIIEGIDSINNERVIIQENTYVHKILKEHHPQVTFTFIKSPSEGLTALKENKADIFIHNAFSTEFHQRELGITDLKVLATTKYNYEIVFAVHNDFTPLIPMIEKVIMGISNLEKRLIFDKWINVQIQSPINIKLIISSVTFIILIALFALALVTFWNRRLTTEVNIQTKELRNLARHMDHVREEEKAKLAREIHDELGHTLTALSIGIRQLKTEQDETKRSVKQQELSALVKNASQTSKNIMTDLRPSILEDLGLVAAIEWLTSDFQRTHKIWCKLLANELPFQLTDEAQIALFRITQESLTNIAKHSNATKASVNITIQEGFLILMIFDNGQGLKANWREKEGSYGLKGMYERALALDGKLTIMSDKTDGVQIVVKTPIKAITKV